MNMQLINIVREIFTGRFFFIFIILFKKRSRVPGGLFARGYTAHATV